MVPRAVRYRRVGSTRTQRRTPGDAVGTTSLYRYLTAHPDVGAAFRKEVHYFDRYYERDMDGHLAHTTDANTATSKRLVEYFAPYNQQLYAFLGRDLGWEHE